MTESTEIAPVDEGARAIAASPESEFAVMLDRMLALATNEAVDAAKFETFRKAANEQQDRAERRQYYQDKAAALFELPSIRKDSKIVIAGKNGEADRVQGTFAKWPDMQRAIYPILDRHNLRLTHEVGHEGTIVLVRPVLQHRNGFVEKGEQMALPLDTSGGKNNTQGAGSAQQYGMRYTTVAFLGIRYEAGDDDGNLIALPDEPLNDQQQRRVAEAEVAWGVGRERFDEWFGSIPPIDRAWFIQTGRYKGITGEDIGLLTQKKPDAPKAGDPAPRPAAKKPEAPNTDTPEGWTERYEADCKAAGDLEALARVQAKGKRGMERLKAGGFDDLHARAVKAGGDAYARLAGNDELFDEGER